MRIAATFISILIVNCCFAQDPLQSAQQKIIGEQVDAISFSSFLLNAPADTAIQGKYKVLEFWATWCRPCLAAVPHINRLREEFADADSLVFLSVTDETAAKVASTLQKVKFETIVVNDTTRSLHRKLRVQYQGTMRLPRTVLVDNHNRIVWIGSPKQLTEGRLKRFLGNAGKL